MKSDWLQMANDALNEFGYLVMASTRELEIGEIVQNCRPTPDNQSLGQPFRVYARATEQEYSRQTEFVYGREAADDHGDLYFYKVTTD